MFRLWIKNLVRFVTQRDFSFISFGDTQLMHFARHGRADRIRIEEIFENDLLARNDNTESFLSLCINSGLNNIVKSLIQKHPDLIHQLSGPVNDNLLFQCVNFDNLELFNFLINQKVDLNFINEKHEHILSLCSKKKEFAEAVVLISFDFRETPLSVRKSIITSFSQATLPEKYLIRLVRSGIIRQF